MMTVRMLFWRLGIAPDPRPEMWFSAGRSGDRLGDTLLPILFALMPHWRGIRSGD